jgi:uncharacterized protein (DUF697 family)
MAQNALTAGLPDSEQQIAAVEGRCRQMVNQRALWSAGVSAVPLPALDIVADMGLFKRLINDINAEFGLTPRQIDRLQPSLRQVATQAVASVGGATVGKLVTSNMLSMLLRRTVRKQITRQITKYVPVAGQLVAAAVGFAAFRLVGNHHIASCVAVAREVLQKRQTIGV